MTVVQALLIPAFIHVALTFSLLLRTGAGRVAAVRRGKISPRAVVLDNSKWPENLRKITNNYENQFELPVLYYGALALLLTTGQADSFSVVLSWAFVATRLVHSLIHTTNNHLLYRFLAFVCGSVVLMVLWGWFALRLFAMG